MASFDSIDYSLRPSKAIHRALVFKAIKEIHDILRPEDPIYIGLGSIWFVDFICAHKLLDIDSMFSIEADEIGYSRAMYNRTFQSIEVIHGQSNQAIPALYEAGKISGSPWIMWLDYDQAIDEQKLEEMQWIIANAPEKSVILFTFTGQATRYGTSKAKRPKKLKSLFGVTMPDEPSDLYADKDKLPFSLAKLSNQFLLGEAAGIARDG